MTMIERKRNAVGLDAHRRIDPNLPENMAATLLSLHGLSAKAIERATGLSPSAVHYRNHKSGIQLREYRDGTGKMARQVLVRCSVRSMADLSPDERQTLRRDMGI